MGVLKSVYPENYVHILQSFMDPPNYAVDKPEHPNTSNFDPEGLNPDGGIDRSIKIDPIFALFFSDRDSRGNNFLY